jgi:urease accessory protein
VSGRIVLACARSGGRSSVMHLRYEGLSRVSRPRRDAGAAHVVLAHLGPGILGGDVYDLDVAVEPDAALFVTGQMATPVYARERPSSLRAAWRVARGGSLAVRGEPLMLDTGARHDVDVTLDVAGGASAVLADIVTLGAGAVARLRTTARIAGRLVARDACDLRAHAGAIATVVAVCDDAGRRAAMAGALHAALGAAGGVRGGIGSTAGAVVLRATGTRVWDLQRLVDAGVNGIRALPEFLPL